MYIPTKKAFFDLTPEEFEIYSLDLLREQSRGLEDVIIEHNKIVEAFDGNYQIDGYIEFTVMGAKYKTIIECKHYKESIPREKVELLHGRIQSMGAQKGILISTSNFQSGAIEYAKIHGIALVQLTEENINYEARGQLDFLAHSATPIVSFSKPYTGVLISKSDSGEIDCSYLSNYNSKLKDFLILWESSSIDGKRKSSLR